MKEKIVFRKDVLDALPAANRQYEVGDAKTPNLRLMINPGGSKTFILYRKVNNKARRIKIGRYGDLKIEQARKQAERLNAQIALGQDPYEEKKAKRIDLTFHEAYLHYYENHALKFTKNPDADKRKIERHFLPYLGNCKVNNIGAEEILSWFGGLAKSKSKHTANRTFDIVRAAFNYMTKHGLYKHNNPCSGVKKFKSVSRDRFLTLKELRLFFFALQFEDQLYQDYYLLSLYTGARKSNVLSMKWAQINFDLKSWRIAEDRTKNSDVNMVYLSEAALQILERRYKNNRLLDNPSPFVLPGDGKEGHLADPKKSFNRIRNRMQVHDIRIHDLRRTLGSYMAISGASLLIIGKALNHKDPESTMIYARLSQDPVFDAVNSASQLIIKNDLLSLARANFS